MKKQLNRLDEDKLELLGTIIREIRLQLNLTQKDVSAATGIHINTLSYIEGGKSCGLKYFLLLSYYYNLKPSEILAVVDL